jgi:hypothetical protein
MSEPRAHRFGLPFPFLRDHLPALLLVLVALAQVCLTWGGGRLNPDKGGGFGMFSTVDRLNHRHFRACLIGPEGEKVLDVPAGHPLRPSIRRATSFPSDGHLREVASLLAQEQSTSAIRVEVWKHAFDPSSLQVRPLQVAALTAGRAGHVLPPP